MSSYQVFSLVPEELVKAHLAAGLLTGTSTGEGLEQLLDHDLEPESASPGNCD